MLDGLRKWISGAKTIKFQDCADPCDICGARGCEMFVDVDSLGHREHIFKKCPKCGPTKHLYSRRPEPRLEDAFIRAMLGERKSAPKR